ncbi:general substrate transporter [Talaromyces proteolyticus]|uniref:General substrate transporter n=1 Tax=Talaromyces proteolyticus TaxID=1131652 RepID=A0AAD4KL16_9EURO|nr:general substrate transporter [Talaromyces proteolyticus]KAH8690616.1 general substrate transporter [Talaromyces proteolyticus]
MIYLFVSFGSINFGFDISWWASCLGVDEFKEKYGVSPGPGQPKVIPTTWQSAGSGTPNAGMAIGCLLGGYANFLLGRKKTIALLSVIAIVGIIIQVSTDSYWGIIVGRTINGLSIGMEANVIPTYSAELAPPAIRGSLVNFYQWWQIIGNILASSCIYGTARHLSGQWTYKTVMIVQLVIPIILLSGVWFLPESPRWLLNKHRPDQALRALENIRKGSATTEAIHGELALIQEAMREEEELHQSSTWLDCFRGPNLRRTMIATGVQVFQQIQGNSFMNNYLVVFLQQIGITNSLQVYIASNCTQLGGITLAFYFADKIGRRPILFFGAFIMACFMFIIGGLSTYSKGGVTGSTAQGCVAAILLYQAVAAGAWGSCTWATTAEAATTQLREKTTMFATFWSFTIVILVTYINPYVQDPGYGNLGSRVGFVFGGCSILAMVWVAFFLPELKGRSLEELDEMFNARVSVWNFHSYKCSGIGAKITEIQDKNAKGEDVGAKLLEGVKPITDVTSNEKNLEK